MTRITITTDEGTDTVIVSGDVDDHRQIVERHGYDPDEVEWSVEKDASDRISDLEEASGVGAKGPKRGIAHRIDNLEDEVEAIKEEIGMS